MMQLCFREYLSPFFKFGLIDLAPSETFLQYLYCWRLGLRLLSGCLLITGLTSTNSAV
jgi:hypothetical protein